MKSLGWLLISIPVMCVITLMVLDYKFRFLILSVLAIVILASMVSLGIELIKSKD